MSDWVEDLTPDERDAWDEFVNHFRREAIEQIAGSAAFVSIVPSDPEGWDVKFAVELGSAIMLDKPILAVLAPGATISGKLKSVCEVTVEADVDTEEGRDQITRAISDFLAIVKKGEE